MLASDDVRKAPEPAFSVIVPVYNEATIIDATATSLMEALESQSAEVIYVCNGTHDGSAEKIRRIVDANVRVLELPNAGKTAALNAAERLVTTFPRFYLDADVTLDAGTLPALAEVLRRGDADLVSPHIDFDLSTSTWAARAISKTWSALPHGQHGAYHHLLGVSAAGRKQWGAFPQIIGDDAFIEAMVPMHRRKILDQVSVTTRPPDCFITWVRVRARWLQGQRELARMGIKAPRHPEQHTALWKQITRWRTAPQAITFLAARLLASPVCLWAEHRKSGWFHDRSTNN